MAWGLYNLRAPLPMKGFAIDMMVKVVYTVLFCVEGEWVESDIVSTYLPSASTALAFIAYRTSGNARYALRDVMEVPFDYDKLDPIVKSYPNLSEFENARTIERGPQ